MSEVKSANLVNQDKGSPAANIHLPIHFEKSSQFRVIHASGVWFGGDAQQNLHLTFFNERSPIPKRIVLNINQEGIIVAEDESQRDSKVGVVREMEVDVILSMQAALELHKALGDNLKVLGETIKAATKTKDHE